MKALVYIVIAAIQPVIIAWLGGFDFERNPVLGFTYIAVLFCGLVGYIIYDFFENYL